MLSSLALAAALTVLGQTPAMTDPDGLWPLSPTPEVVTGFDPPESPFGAGHRGVDLAGRPGQWVRAALPGRIAFAGVVAGRGVVVVDHGGTRTTYESVAGVLPVGTTVAAGDVIGLLQVTGSHCFPAAGLHWGWIRGSTYLDPLRLVDAPGPVRLWPWEQPASEAGQARVPRPWASWESLLGRWGHALGCACW